MLEAEKAQNVSEERKFFDKEEVNRGEVLSIANRLMSKLDFIYLHDEKLMTCVCVASLGEMLVGTGKAEAMQRSYYSKETGEQEAKKKALHQLNDKLVEMELYHQLRLINPID